MRKQSTNTRPKHQPALIETLEQRQLFSVPVVAQPWTDTIYFHNNSGHANATPSDFSVTVNWGDGTQSTTTAISPEPGETNPVDFIATATHTYKQAGSLTGNNDIIFNYIGPAPASYRSWEGSLDVGVQDAPITPVPTNIAVVKGAAYSGPVGSFEYDNPYASPADFLVNVQFNDPVTDKPLQGTLTNSGDTWTVSVEDAHFSLGDYAPPADLKLQTSILHKLSNGSYGSSASVDSPVTTLTGPVIDPPPLNGNITVDDTGEIPVATIKDPPDDPRVFDLPPIVNCGDGPVPGTFVPIPGTPNFEIVVTHDFPKPGNYPITVTVREKSGPQSTSTETIHVVAKPKDVIKPQFDWSMPDRYGIDTNNNGLIDLPNSKAYADPAGFTLDLNASTTVSNVAVADYEWIVTGNGQDRTEEGETAHVDLLPQGVYSVELEVTATDGTVAKTTQSVRVRDLLIVSLGDSYASGEGNPDKPMEGKSPALWADGLTDQMTEENRQAHRSTFAASSLTAMAIEDSSPKFSVTFVMLAESGATIAAGMLGPKTGSEDPNPAHPTAADMVPGQLSELRSIIGNRKIDLLTLSIGGNDIGFSTRITQLLAHTTVGGVSIGPSLKTIQQGVNAGLTLLNSNKGFDDLDEELKTFSIAHVVISDYPDPTRASGGVKAATIATDVVPGLKIDPTESDFAKNDIIAPLNALIAEEAKKFGWSLVGNLSADFAEHGYAMPPGTRWFRTEAESRLMEGSPTSISIGISPIKIVLVPISPGAVHPNKLGQEDISKRQLELVDPWIVKLLAG